MQIKAIVDEDFSNYVKPAMMVAFPSCTFKCCIEAHLPISTCQNCPIYELPSFEISADEILRRYQKNAITCSFVLGGMEPLDSSDDVVTLVNTIRKSGCDDEIVIYTGYYKNEVSNIISKLADYKNIIIKYGRYIPNQAPHFDKVLGVSLASDNQYAEKI